MKVIFDILSKELEETKGCGMVFLILLIAVAVWISFTYLGVWLWKMIMVQIFGLPALSFWQFVGLDMLISLLFPTYNGGDKK